MTERMTDTQWEDVKDDLRRHGGIAENAAADECDRARRVEQEQAELLAKLSAILLRFVASRPSVEHSNWGGEDLLGDAESILRRAGVLK